MTRAALLALLLAGCAAQPEPQARCTIRPLAITSRDLITPRTMANLKHLNNEIVAQCGPAPKPR